MIQLIIFNNYLDFRTTIKKLIIIAGFLLIQLLAFKTSASSISLNEIDEIKNLSFYDIKNGLAQFHFCNPSKDSKIKFNDPNLLKYNEKTINKLIDFINSYLEKNATQNNQSTSYHFKVLKIIPENPSSFYCDLKPASMNSLTSKIKVHLEQVLDFKYGNKQIISIPVEGSRVIVDFNEFSKIEDVRFVKIFKYPSIDLKEFKINMESLKTGIEKEIQNLKNTILTPFINKNGLLEFYKNISKKSADFSTLKFFDTFQNFKNGDKPILYFLARPKALTPPFLESFNYVLRLNAPFGINSIFELTLDLNSTPHQIVLTRTESNINKLNDSRTDNAIIEIQDGSLSGLVGNIPFNPFLSNKIKSNSEQHLLENTFQIILDYFKNCFDYLSFDNKNSPLNVIYNLDLEDLKENAAWVKSPVNRLLIGKSQNTELLFASTDILTHEFFHGIMDSQNPLVFENESGAIAEHLSDIFGIAARLYNTYKNDNNQLKDLNLNNELRIGYKLTSPIRDFINPTQSAVNIFTNKADAERLIGYFCPPTSSNDNCGVHIQSGIPSIAIAKSILRLGVIFKNRFLDLPEYNAVQSIAQLIFKVSISDLSGNPSFKEYASQLVKECKNPNSIINFKLNADDCNIFEEEFKKVGILK